MSRGTAAGPGREPGARPPAGEPAGPRAGPQAPAAGLRIAYVLATSGGGTGAHVAMLAAGCAERGAAVTVYGPAATGARFFPAAGSLPGIGSGNAVPAGAVGSPAPAGAGGRRAAQVTFIPVEIAERPRPARDAAAVLRLRRLLARTRPQVVHAHGLRAGGLAALALLPGPTGLTGRTVLAGRPRPARPALLVTVHNAAPPGVAAGLAYRLLELLAARRADEVTCVSADLSARMRRLGARGGGRALVPAPPAEPPTPQEVAAARAAMAGAGRPVVLAAGRLAPQKGLAELLDAAARWRGLVPAPRVAVAGDGPLAAALRARAMAAGVDAVFLGQRTDVPALLAAADVVAVPSKWEGQPLVVQEALRAGRPVVATRVGGIPELTGEDGALLVPPGDPAALAAAVAAVLADPALAARLGRAAHARAALLPSPADAVTAALAACARLAARPAPGPVRGHANTVGGRPGLRSWPGGRGRSWRKR